MTIEDPSRNLRQSNSSIKIAPKRKDLSRERHPRRGHIHRARQEQDRHRHEGAEAEGNR